MWSYLVHDYLVIYPSAIIPSRWQPDLVILTALCSPILWKCKSRTRGRNVLICISLPDVLSAQAPYSFPLQAQLEAACASSVPCPSCSAISTMSATSLPEMTIPTGCPLQSPCQCLWHPSLGTILDRLLAGELSICRRRYKIEKGKSLVV